MADNSGILKIALFGGAAYLAYTQGWLSFLGLSPSGSAAPPATAPTGGTAASAGTTTPPAQPPAKTYPPLSQIFQGMVQKAVAAASSGSGCGPQPAVTLTNIGGVMVPDPSQVVATNNWLLCQGNLQNPLFTSDDWNAFVVQAGGPDPMPDPGVVFSGQDRSAKMSALQYWSGMSAALGHLGLSGYYRFGRAA